MASSHAAILFVEVQVGEPGCDLVDAINSANNNASEGGCFALHTYGDDTIQFLIDDIVLDDTASAFGGTPPITSNIHIVGPSQSLLTTIERSHEVGTPNFRLFSVGSTGNLTLENIELVNGNVDDDPSDGSHTGNNLYVSGSAILKNVSIRDSEGGAGAIYIAGRAATHASLQIEKSSFYNNKSASRGGAINVAPYSKVSIYDSTFTNNTASAGGGAIAIHGIETYVFIYNTTITENTGDGSQNFGSQGGGIFASSAIQTLGQKNQLVIRNSIISSNIAGGASSFSAADEFFLHNPPSGQSFSNITVDNNIIGHADISTDTAVSGYSVDSSNILVTSDSDLPTPFNKILSPLRQKSKSQSYYPPIENSPAIDTGVPFRVTGSPPLAIYEPGCTGLLATVGLPAPYRSDQRDVERPIGSGCDIGAIEYEPETEQCYVFPTPNDKMVVFCL